MDDAYRNIGRLYLALLSPEQVRGDRLGDDAMNRWMLDVPPGAHVCHVGPHPVHLIVIGTRHQEQELCVGGLENRASID